MNLSEIYRPITATPFDTENYMEYLVDTLPQNDVWSISWSWFENKDKYPKESSISENWCKAYKAIDKLIFLKNFGRIDEVL